VNEKLALGVDGGGTKTVAWLARSTSDCQPDVLGRGSAGSSNWRAVGQETALKNLSLAIDSAWKDANRKANPTETAVLALAGAGQADVQARVTEWALQCGVAKKAQVVHDGRAVLNAGAMVAWGVALVAGTGSVAFAMDKSGQESVVGGWGYLFGDEGSAFWLGQAALRAISHADDDRGATTLLTQKILDRLRTESPREMLSILSRTGDQRREIAGLADLVIEAAEQQDAVAMEIVERGVGYLATLARCAAEKLSLGQRFPLALAGGVLCGSQLVREKLLLELQNEGISPSSLEVVRDPVLGCLRLACRDIVTS